jgi:hypothetical protein
MKEVEPIAEKRQSPRVKASAPVRYRVIRQGAEEPVNPFTCLMTRDQGFDYKQGPVLIWRIPVHSNRTG